MNKNMGVMDRVIRLLIGAGALAAGYYYQSWWGALGIIPIGTAFIAWCPMYVPFGIRTCRATDAAAQSK